MPLSIKADATPGDSIEETCEEAVKLATKLGCYVTVNFNGVLVDAGPWSNPGILSRGYYAELLRQHGKQEPIPVSQTQ